MLCICYYLFTSRFRCLATHMQQGPERCTTIVLAACVLHNLIRTKFPKLTNHLVDHEDPSTHEVIPGPWRDEVSLCCLNPMRGNNMTQTAKAQRQYLCEYFSSEAGSVTWQEDMI
jgi:hypothetical protein